MRAKNVTEEQMNQALQEINKTFYQDNIIWNRFEKNTGIDRNDAIIRLREFLGEDYRSREVSELYLRDLLRELY